MQFNEHRFQKGKHAAFAASTPDWIHYNPEKAIEYVNKVMAKNRGTELHALAEQCIKLHIFQRHSDDTFCQYVNDAIRFRMEPEVLLYYSDWFFGTADSIVYEEDTKKLRIHDLKTGTGKVHPEQLLVYAAYFCLEYKKDPYHMTFELRIYQNNSFDIFEPTPEEVKETMDHIISLNKIMNDTFTPIT